MKLDETSRLLGVLPISFVFLAHSLLCLLAGTEEGSAAFNALLLLMGIFYAVMAIGLVREKTVFRRVVIVYSSLACMASVLMGLFLIYAQASQHPFTRTWSVESWAEFLTGNFIFNLISLLFFSLFKFRTSKKA